MQKKRLGKTDLHLTRLGLGTWAMGGGAWKFGWGPQDEKDAVGAVRRAVDLGINWIDTAPVYGNGRAEELVGQGLKSLGSQRPFVATKFGRILQPDGSIKGRIKRQSVLEECEASLRRLGVAAIDLYQMHWPEPEEDLEEAWQTMCDLKAQGKVRQIGVSNCNVTQLSKLLKIHDVASLQPPYSLFAPGIEEEILPFCGRHQMGVVCYSPMGKGLLTGRFDKKRAEQLPDSDHRSRDPKFAEPQLSINLELVDGLQKIASRHGRSVANLAVGWTLRRAEVTAAIVGARSPTQIEEIVAGGDWELGEEIVREIDARLAQRKAKIDALGPLDAGRV